MFQVQDACDNCLVFDREQTRVNYPTVSYADVLSGYKHFWGKTIAIIPQIYADKTLSKSLTSSSSYARFVSIYIYQNRHTLLCALKWQKIIVSTTLFQMSSCHWQHATLCQFALSTLTQ